MMRHQDLFWNTAAQLHDCLVKKCIPSRHSSPRHSGRTTTGSFRLGHCSPRCSYGDTPNHLARRLKYEVLWQSRNFERSSCYSSTGGSPNSAAHVSPIEKLGDIDRAAIFIASSKWSRVKVIKRSYALWVHHHSVTIKSFSWSGPLQLLDTGFPKTSRYLCNIQPSKFLHSRSSGKPKYPNCQLARSSKNGWSFLHCFKTWPTESTFLCKHSQTASAFPVLI